MTKEELRSKYLKLRKDLSGKKEKSALIADKLFKSGLLSGKKTVACYASLPSEPDTFPIISRLLLSGYSVCLPCVNGSSMDFYYISNTDELIPGSFGIKEPLPDPVKKAANEDIDIVLVPGICFDTRGGRIGYGKGYYDRFLKNGSFSVGICFEENYIKEQIPEGPYDMRVNIILTDRGLYQRRIT